MLNSYNLQLESAKWFTSYHPSTVKTGIPPEERLRAGHCSIIDDSLGQRAGRSGLGRSSGHSFMSLDHLGVILIYSCAVVRADKSNVE